MNTVYMLTYAFEKFFLTLRDNTFRYFQNGYCILFRGFPWNNKHVPTEYLSL